MPVYCYSTKDGAHTIERYYPMDKRPRSIRHSKHGRMYLDVGAMHRTARPACNIWPKVSIFDGVHPNQVGEARKFAQQRGINVEILDTGQIKYLSRRGRKDWHKATHQIDRDGGYGDHTETRNVDVLQDYRIGGGFRG